MHHLFTESQRALSLNHRRFSDMMWGKNQPSWISKPWNRTVCIITTKLSPGVLLSYRTLTLHHIFWLGCLGMLSVSTLLTWLNCLPRASVPGHKHIIRKGHRASCLVNKITSRWQILAQAEPDLPRIPLPIKHQQGCRGSLRWFLITSFTWHTKQEEHNNEL